MPQLLILAAIGAGAYIGARWVRSKANQFAADLEEAKRAMEQKKRSTAQGQNLHRSNVAELKQDPLTGVYKVEKE